MKTPIIILTLALSGCAVSMVKPENWIPPRTSTAQDLHICYMEAQTPTYYANHNYARGNIDTKWAILESCMHGQGYVLRDITDKELMFTFATLPISIVGAVMVNDRLNFY